MNDIIVDVIGVAGTNRFEILLFVVYGDFDMSAGPLMVLLVGEVGVVDKNGYG